MVCPLRFVLVFFSVIIAGWIAWRHGWEEDESGKQDQSSKMAGGQSGEGEQREVDGTGQSDEKKSSSRDDTCFWWSSLRMLAQMSSGWYIYRVWEQRRLLGRNRHHNHGHQNHDPHNMAKTM
ncbi:hypothetical protein CBR_g85115 [Chara braunii]|uniref:Uncharacterized protein n=1 Tax=Chara braunii TaxID=69332 RepID=A0A388JK93_CHABU|nr:hypothetical protein CBR_g85115 [Chara braunii]|eukprot:GBG44286.1 hypothetical protein CBR_g85115 [Chara braunii]